MYPHRIRLLGPWQAEPLNRSRGHEPCRVTLRDVAGDGAGFDPFPGYTGEFVLRRGFGYPGQIDSYERVWIVLLGVPNFTVGVNGADFGRCPSADVRHDITTLLQPRNELTLRGEYGVADCPVDAYLEVTCSAWLSPPKTDGRQVSGEILGSADGLLEVYLVTETGQAGYQAFSPGQTDRRFSFVCPPGVRSARLELVRGAVVWYSAMVLISE